MEEQNTFRRLYEALHSEGLLEDSLKDEQTLELQGVEAKVDLDHVARTAIPVWGRFEGQSVRLQAGSSLSRVAAGILALSVVHTRGSRRLASAFGQGLKDGASVTEKPAESQPDDT